MAKDSIGVIFGKTSSLNFRFAVSDSLATRRSDYIKVWHESDGWTLGQVSTITSSNEDFSVEEAVDVAEGSSKIGDMNEQIIADATVIGVRDKEGVLRAPKSPFSPGDKVFKADELLIKQTLGLMRGDVYIGLLDGQNVHVNLDANNLVQKHCSILAKTGAGKSYTGGVILEELLDKNVPLLIIDPHGEYATLKFPNDDKPDAVADGSADDRQPKQEAPGLRWQRLRNPERAPPVNQQVDGRAGQERQGQHLDRTRTRHDWLADHRGRRLAHE